MKTLRFLGKLFFVLVVGVILRILASFCVLLKGGVDMPPSAFVKHVGEAPVAFSMIFISYFFLAIVFILFEKNMRGTKIAKGLKYGACFAAIWIFGMFESCIVAGSPFLYELNFGLSDGLPILAFGLLLGGVFASDSRARDARETDSAFNRLGALVPILCVAVVYSAMRYFTYIAIDADGAYFVKPVPAFLWTFGNGAIIGIVAFALRDMVSPFRPYVAFAALGFLILGSDIFLYNLFMPALMDFGPIVTVKKFFVRELLDATAIFLALCLARLLPSGVSPVATKVPEEKDCAHD